MRTAILREEFCHAHIPGLPGEGNSLGLPLGSIDPAEAITGVTLALIQTPLFPRHKY